MTRIRLTSLGFAQIRVLILGEAERRIREIEMAEEGLEFQDSNAAGIEWTVHPVKGNWKVSTGVVLFIVTLCTAIYFSFNSVAFLIMSIAIFACSLAPFFFPTTYILRDDCVIIKSLLRTSSKQWGSFKSYYPDKNGVLLSPFPYPSRLESFRGVYIRFNNNRLEVVDFIKGKIKPAGS